MTGICPRRFCCKFSIASGVGVIGYSNFVQAVCIITLYAVLELYIWITVAILPLLCLRSFFKMMKKDGIKPRFRFYVCQTLKSITIDILLTYNIIDIKLSDYCETNSYRACAFDSAPWFEVAICVISL